MRFLCLFPLLLLLFGCGSNRINYGPYSIGRDPTWYGLQMDEKTTNLNAFTTSIAQQIAEVESIPIEVHDFANAQLLDMLEKHRIGALFSAIEPSIVTQKKYRFSEPIFALGPVLVVPLQSQVETLKDLSGKQVAVYQFDDSVLIASRNPEIIITQYQNMGMVLQDLAEGKIDAVLMPVVEAEALVGQLYPAQLKIATEPLSNKAIRLITLKDYNESLFKHFAQGLKRIRRTGKFEKLRQEFNVNLFKSLTICWQSS